MCKPCFTAPLFDCLMPKLTSGSVSMVANIDLNDAADAMCRGHDQSYCVVQNRSSSTSTTARSTIRGGGVVAVVILKQQQ